MVVLYWYHCRLLGKQPSVKKINICRQNSFVWISCWSISTFLKPWKTSTKLDIWNQNPMECTRLARVVHFFQFLQTLHNYFLLYQLETKLLLGGITMSDQTIKLFQTQKIWILFALRGPTPNIKKTYWYSITYQPEWWMTNGLSPSFKSISAWPSDG